MPQVQDQSLNLLTCSPACYYCTTAAPLKPTSNIGQTLLNHEFQNFYKQTRFNILCLTCGGILYKSFGQSTRLETSS